MVWCLEALPQIDYRSLTGRKIHMCGYMCVYILSNTYISPPWLSAHWRSLCFGVQHCHRVRTAINGSGQRQRYIAVWLYTHTRAHAHTRARAHRNTKTHTNRKTHTHKHRNTDIQTHKEKHSDTNTHKHRHTRTQKHTHPHKHRHTRTQKHTHPHKHTHTQIHTNTNPNIDTKHRNTNTDTQKHTQDRIMRAFSDVTLTCSLYLCMSSKARVLGVLVVGPSGVGYHLQGREA
jgi:hypothetical protein